MSQEADAQVLTGKAKKAKRSEERFKKNKKTKTEETTTADAPKNDEAATAEADDQNATLDKASTKKRKRSQEDKEQASTTTENAAPVEAKQQKKRKKEPSANKEPLAKKAGDATTGEGDEAAAKNQRFIVFIGNLPFTATTEQITEHFASIQPQSVRHSTEKGTNKSKGFAFLEFANYDRMKTCLKLYHHSMFDSGIGGERGKRRINVELTAGGGGSKSEGRKEKLKEKNVRLNEQRQRRAEAEAKQEKRKAAKDAKKGGAPGADKGEEAPEPEADTAVPEGIHPARLAMLQRINNR
jgi:nucleolar protein 6